MSSTTEIVNQILEEDERAKSDDKWLCYKVYEYICNENKEAMWIPFNLFKILPAFETISRTRRKFNEVKEAEEVKIGIISTKPMSLNTAPNSRFL